MRFDVVVIFCKPAKEAADFTLPGRHLVVVGIPMPAVRAGAEWWPVVLVIVLPVPSDAECLFTSSPSAFLRWVGGASAQIAGPCLTGLFISSLSLESSLHPREKR